MRKLLIFLLSLTVVFSLAGCSNGADGKSTTESTSRAAKTTVGTLGKSISYKLSKKDARAAAEKALEKWAVGFGMHADDFEYADTELYGADEGYISFNRGYGNTSESENFTGHAYYVVRFTDTTQIAGFAYFCIDAVDGSQLFGSYMGD